MKTTSNLILTLFLILIYCTTLKAQDDSSISIGDSTGTQPSNFKTDLDSSEKHWHKGGIFSLTGQEGTQTDWAAGGQNFITLGGLVNTFFNYHNNKIIWNNNIILAYSTIKRGTGTDWIKNDDRIQLTTKVGYSVFEKGYITLLGDFKSQFTPGYHYPNDSTIISRFMAPGYALASLGLNVDVIDTSFSVFLSPCTGRFTFVEDNTLAKEGAYGVQGDVYTNGVLTIQHKNFREQIGAYLKVQYREHIVKNILLATTLELYSDYIHNPQNLYVNWTTLFVLKVHKLISTTFNTQLIYDPAVKIKQADGAFIGPRTQFKQILGVGLVYKF